MTNVYQDDAIGPVQIGKSQLASLSNHYHSAFMVQGSPVPKVVQWIVVRMGPLLSTQDIANYTDLSERKVRHILMHF
jgi:hypothetical protein